MKREYTACILKPRGPFHVGEREGMREGSAEFIHSDTLFSALCHSYLLLYGKQELERFFAAENGADPPLVLSSAFPWWNGRLYFPMPRNFIPQKKETKRIRFVEQSAFETLLTDSMDDDKLNPYGLPAEVIKTGDVPKVTVSRTGGSAQEEGGFYHVGLTYYDRDAGLYFLTQVADGWRDKVTAAIRLMCDEGIGGYRTAGKGQFEQPDLSRTLTLDEPESADACLTLSLYYPGDAESHGLSDGFYDLVPRRGYVFSPETHSVRRRQVMLFVEGSVFPENGDCTACPRAQGDCPRFRGRLVDVTPDDADKLGLAHKVYRNGLAFTVPCRLARRGHSERAERVEESLLGQKGGPGA